MTTDPELEDVLRRVEAARAAHARSKGESPRAAPAPLPRIDAAPAPLPLLPAQPSNPEETPNAAALDAASLFLEALFSVWTPGEIMLKARASNGWRRPTWHTKTEDAAKRAIAGADSCDVYFGVGRRIERDEGGSSVPELGFAWADFDGNNDAEVDAFIDRIMEAQLPPSVAVQTSPFGLHCYWLLDRGRESADVQEVVARLAERFRADSNATDIARVLRVPGTRNRKPGRNGFRVRFYSAGGRWWSPEDGLSQIRRYALEELPAPSRQARQARGNVAAFVSSEPMHELLRALEHDVPGARRRAYQGSDKIVLRCLFHADAHESAVVFANGWYHCSSSACGVSLPASKWTTRREAKPWSETVRARKRETARVGVGRDGYFRAPRVGIRDVGRALLSIDQPSPMRSKLWIDHDPGEQIRLGAQRSEGALQPVAFDDVCDELRAVLPMAYRTLWASIVLAQLADQGGVHQGGVFPVTVPLLGRMLGYSMSNGELNHKPRQAIQNALKLLERIKAEIQWSDATASSRARLLTPLSEERRGSLVYWTFALHPGIHKQVVGRSQAYGHLRPEALKLEPERLAVYAEAQFELRQHGRGRAELRLPLTNIAQRAGVPLDLRTDRLRQLRRWAADYDQHPRLGLQVVEATAELVVSHQEPVTVADIEPMRSVLHAAPPPPGLPEWTRLVAEGGSLPEWTTGRGD